MDSLEYHKMIKDKNAPIGNINTKIIPSFRPDKAINIINLKIQIAITIRVKL